MGDKNKEASTNGLVRLGDGDKFEYVLKRQLLAVGWFLFLREAFTFLT